MDDRISQRWLIGLITVTVLLAVADLSWAAEFSADTIIDRLGQKQQVKLYIKDRQIRAEMEDAFGQEQILISRPGKDQTFMLYPKTKGYMAFPATAVFSPVDQDEETAKKNGGRKLIGQEDIEGYLCDKYEITFCQQIPRQVDCMGSPQARLPDSDDPGRRSSHRLPESEADEYQRAAYRGFHVQGPGRLQKGE